VPLELLQLAMVLHAQLRMRREQKLALRMTCACVVGRQMNDWVIMCTACDVAALSEHWRLAVVGFQSSESWRNSKLPELF
jgi:hypothetical protein